MYYHRIEDKFTPVVIEKLKECGVTEVKQIQCNDDHEMITEAIQTLIEDGSDLIVCTGGMSVDPDDRTPLAIKNACMEVVTYGGTGSSRSHVLCLLIVKKKADRFRSWVFRDA